MKTKVRQAITILTCCVLFTSCVSNYKLFLRKNECYQQQLSQIRQHPDYNTLMTTLQDSLRHWKQRFSTFQKYQADSSVFFSKTQDSCMLIIASVQSDSMGPAKIVFGEKNAGKWTLHLYKPGHGVIFSDASLQFFRNPTADDVARLMRFEIMKRGNVRLKGCAIDQQYWFGYLYGNDPDFKERLRIKL